MAVSLADQESSVHDRPVIKKLSAGLQICCLWKDGSTSWEELSDLKESHPVYKTKFEVAQKTDYEPEHESAFNQWVKHMLKKQD